LQFILLDMEGGVTLPIIVVIISWVSNKISNINLCNFMLVWNLVSHINGTPYTEGVREEGAEGDISVAEGGGSRILEETASWGQIL